MKRFILFYREPVKVRNVYDFGYADGTPFYPVGTTCYAWVHQPEELVKQTLQSLAETKFNKIRMTVMPKVVKFRLEVIDAWNMIITPFEGAFSGITEIPLPGIPYIAVRATKIK